MQNRSIGMRLSVFLIVLVALAGWLWFIFVFLHYPTPQGPRAKGEWADLQGLEYELNSKAITQVTIESLGKRAFLKIPASQSSGLGVVILLKSESEPYYKQMPDGPYRLSEADVEKVEASGLASSTVLAVLSSHVESK